MGTEVEPVARSADPQSTSLPNPGLNPGNTPAETRTPEPLPPAIPLPRDVAMVFEVSQDGKDVLIKLVDRQSDRVIRQIPPEEMRRIRAAMREMVGLLLDRKG